MLSPHEFATLMLVRQAPDQLDMNRAELDALLERQLVMLEHCAAGARRAYLTGKGETFLQALHPDASPRRRPKAATGGADESEAPPPRSGERTTDMEVDSRG
ncbi:hypothetical protein [Paraburkholderia guartelaensis]|uniref:hypothetical protein n=1 Tax=Paraburkholderia guartelaensis TaxID=2546446 RepID=UPI001FE63DE8|nr:hypothetical protein [Paraburkholderia guartelaensis]